MTTFTGRVGMRHETRKCNDGAAEHLLGLMENNEQTSQVELAHMMSVWSGVRWSREDINRGLKENGIVRKKMFKRAKEACKVEQAAWEAYFLAMGYKAKQVVSIDETHTNNHTCNDRYVSVPIGQQSQTAAYPFGQGRSYSIVGAISCKGLIAKHVAKGGIDQEMFMEWFEFALVPLLNAFPGDDSVVVIDNCAIHHKAEIDRLCWTKGAHAEFLPPYSPEYAPIEKTWCTYKQWLKTHKEYVVTIPGPQAIAKALQSITPSMCEAWIRGVEAYDN